MAPEGRPAARLLQQQPVHFPHCARVGLRRRLLDHHHVIDLNRAGAPVPILGRCRRVSEHTFQRRVGGHRIAGHDRVQFACKQHGHGILACRRALDRGRLAVFGDVRILEAHPTDAIRVYTVVVRQDARTQTAVVTE